MPTRITIGRDTANVIVVPDNYDTVSNEHADIYDDENGELFFRDHSSNGTQINGQRIQNTDVRITPGDRIMLAGVYPLEWQTLRSYFPGVKRPTVGYNNHGGAQDEDTGSKTQIRNHVSSAGMTERFDRRPSNDPAPSSHNGTAYEDAPSAATLADNAPKPAAKPRRSNRKLPWTTIISVLVGALIVLLIFGFFVFDDVFYNLF